MRGKMPPLLTEVQASATVNRIDMNPVGTPNSWVHIDIRTWDGSACQNWSYPAGRQNGDRMRREFAALASRWHRETGMHSVQTRITSHPAYLRIIGIGEPAIPLIIQDLQERGGSWYAALRAVTGASPVPEDARGNVPRMKDAWLRWAREHEYIH